MFSYYSPFIQLIAAIYFSMCFEQLIEKFFWNKRYKEEMKKVTQKIEQIFGLTEKDNQDITATLNERYDYFIGRVKKWSILMFLLLIIILFFSGIEQSFKIYFANSQLIAITGSVLVLFPAIGFFIQGWSKTQRHVKKINNMIYREIAVFYQDTQDSIIGNIENKRYAQILAQIFSHAEDGDMINKANMLSEIIQKFKEDSVLKIKNIICET